jgi:glutathione S-transferase
MWQRPRASAVQTEAIMKLYYSPGACSLSPHIVALEGGLPVELEKVDLKTKKTETGADYLKINPKGYVPALDIGGETLTEVPAIVQYLADQRRESGLAPEHGTLPRYRLQEALNFVTAELHKTIGSLFNPAQKGEWKEATLALIDKRLAALDGMLAGKAFMLGEAFTVADAYLFTVLRWTRIHKIDIAKYPNIAAYVARVGARPKVQEALKAEGIS